MIDSQRDRTQGVCVKGNADPQWTQSDSHWLPRLLGTQDRADSTRWGQVTAVFFFFFFGMGGHSFVAPFFWQLSWDFFVAYSTIWVCQFPTPHSHPTTEYSHHICLEDLWWDGVNCCACVCEAVVEMVVTEREGGCGHLGSFRGRGVKTSAPRLAVVFHRVYLFIKQQTTSVNHRCQFAIFLDLRVYVTLYITDNSGNASV